MQSSSLQLCEVGGRLAGPCIQILLLLHLVSALVSRLRPMDAWVGDIICCVFSILFILQLSWILLSRHFLPFCIQDYASVSVVLEWCKEGVQGTRNVIGECVDRVKDICCYGMERVHQVVCTLRVRLRCVMNTRSRDEANVLLMNEDERGHEYSFVAIEMVPTVEEHVAAPTTNIMERLEDADSNGDEPVSPPASKLQDKKQW